MKVGLHYLLACYIEFLSKVMHGEGDLLAHLVIIGYKVLHQQVRFQATMVVAFLFFLVVMVKSSMSCNS